MNDQVSKVQKESAKVTRTRRPINGTRTLLEVRGKQDGFHYAWINEDKVDAALDADYEHVRHPVEVGTKRIDVGSMPAGSHVVVNVGRGVKAFLMRQPQEFFDADQAGEQVKADEQMQARLGEFNKDGLTGSIDAHVSYGRR
jgi:hypothetical protein